MNDHSFLQDDDISILLGEDDMTSVSPHVIPVFNFTASRCQLPMASGITSMEALRNAYEELKKKYNDLNFKYQTLLRLARKSRVSELLPDELNSVSHSLDDEPKIIQINRKDEIEKLHNAILRLNHELSEEKDKNIKLQVQINSYKEMPHPSFEAEKSDKSLNILEELKENIDMLEKSVEFHKAIISKQCKHLDNQPFFGKTDFISQRKQQSEHDELSSLGNKPGHAPPRAIPSTAAAAAAAATVTTKAAQNAPGQHISNDIQKGSSIIDLKGIRQKQDKQKDQIHTFAPPPPTTTTTTHFPKLCTNPLPSSSSSSSSSSATITTTTSSTMTTTTNTNALVREKDAHYLNITETVSSGKSSKQSASLSEMICPICEAPFLDLSKFQEHVFYCKYDPSPDRTCPVCMENFINTEQEKFEQHVHAHFDQTLLNTFEMV